MTVVTVAETMVALLKAREKPFPKDPPDELRPPQKLNTGKTILTDILPLHGLRQDGRSGDIRSSRIAIGRARRKRSKTRRYLRRWRAGGISLADTRSCDFDR